MELSTTKYHMAYETIYIYITKLPESGVLYGNTTEFGMEEDHLSYVQPNILLHITLYRLIKHILSI